MRKLASVRRISDINNIDSADAIECARVDGWNVVVKKGEFKVGDLCIYCEIDSWIPKEVAS
jgi:RNA ligase (TIGR02306 family)